MATSVRWKHRWSPGLYLQGHTGTRGFYFLLLLSHSSALGTGQTAHSCLSEAHPTGPENAEHSEGRAPLSSCHREPLSRWPRCRCVNGSLGQAATGTSPVLRSNTPQMAHHLHDQHLDVAMDPVTASTRNKREGLKAWVQPRQSPPHLGTPSWLRSPFPKEGTEYFKGILMICPMFLPQGQGQARHSLAEHNGGWQEDSWEQIPWAHFSSQTHCMFWTQLNHPDFPKVTSYSTSSWKQGHKLQSTWAIRRIL